MVGLPKFGCKLLLSSMYFLMCVCMCVRVCVCVSAPRLLITSGVIWTPYDWLNNFYSFYMMSVVINHSGHSLRIEALHRNQSNKIKLALYKMLF